MAEPIKIGRGLQDVLSKAQSEGFQSLAPQQQLDELDGMLAATELKRVDDEKLAGLSTWVNDLYTKAKNARSSFEQQWYKNMDMAQGRQFTEWDPNQKKMVEQAKLPHTPRIVVNIIEPVVRTEIAKTGSSHPTATVSPRSTEDEDIQAAEAGEAVWEWWYDQVDFQTSVFGPANWWRAHTGNGFIKTFYDTGCEDEAATAAAQQAADEQAAMQATISPIPTAFGAFGSTTTPQTDGVFPAAPSDGVAAPTMASTAAAPVEPVKGKISAIAVSPFELFVGNLMEVDLQKQPWIIHAYVISIDEALLRYADYVDDKEWRPTATQKTILMDPSHLGMRSSESTDSDSTLVKELWVRPGASKRMPQGGLVVTVGDTVVGLSKDGMPYDHKKYPFAHISGIGTGQFYRRSVIADLIPLQNQTNRQFAQGIQNFNHRISPRYWYDEGSLDPRRVTTKPGQMIPVRLGMNRPVAIEVPDLPGSFGDLLDRLASAKDDISGQHQVSRATSPGADTAASALSILQEVDDNYLSETYDSIATAMRSVGRQMLSLAVQFWDVPRLVKITGADDVVDVQTLDGADLVHGTDLRVDDASALPLSKSAKIATITDWMEKGFISPQVGMQALEMGLLGKTFKQLKVDQDQITRENLKMAKADPAELTAAQQPAAPAQPDLADPNANPFASLNDPAIGLSPQPDAAAPAMPATPAQPWLPINPYDNDQLHILGHANFMKTQRYENLPDENKQAFLDHYNAHIQRAQQAAMPQAAPSGFGSGQPDLQAQRVPDAPPPTDPAMPDVYDGSSAAMQPA
jgi:hypothetical protein